MNENVAAKRKRENGEKAGECGGGGEVLKRGSLFWES